MHKANTLRPITLRPIFHDKIKLFAGPVQQFDWNLGNTISLMGVLVMIYMVYMMGNDIGDVKVTLTKLDAKVTTLDAKVTTLDAKVTTQGAALKDLDSRVTTLDAKVTTQGAVLKDLDARVKDLDSRVTKVRLSMFMLIDFCMLLVSILLTSIFFELSGRATTLLCREIGLTLKNKALNHKSNDNNRPTKKP